MEEINKAAVIVADGAFPVHPVPLGYLEKAEIIVCCDGGAENLLRAGFVPDAIVGDMDSLSDELSLEFADRIHRDVEQESNDLTKAVKWCHRSGYKKIIILGASGKREDHTIGNISLLAEYCRYVNVEMITDTGFFLPFLESCRIKTVTGQQISVFSVDPDTEITSSGLRYPLISRKLKNWWQGTLNEAEGDSVQLHFVGGPVIVFLSF